MNYIHIEHYFYIYTVTSYDNRHERDLCGKSKWSAFATLWYKVWCGKKTGHEVGKGLLTGLFGTDFLTCSRSSTDVQYRTI